MLRNIIRVVRPKLTWLFPADENIWFHRQVAYSMAFWAMFHTTAHYVNFINVERTRAFPLPRPYVEDIDLVHRNSQGICPADPLHPTRRYHRALHALDHGPHVFNRPPEDQEAVL